MPLGERGCGPQARLATTGVALVSAGLYCASHIKQGMARPDRAAMHPPGGSHGQSPATWTRCSGAPSTLAWRRASSRWRPTMVVSSTRARSGHARSAKTGR